MAKYAKEVTQSKLYQQFDLLVDQEDIGPDEIGKLKALVCDVADAVGPHLDRIRDTFWQYTEHDMRHLCNVADLVYRFLPKQDGKDDPAIRLNALELALLWLAILLHDIGMYVSDKEKQETLDFEEYKHFLQLHQDRVAAAQESRDKGLEVRARAIEDALLAEYFRALHPERAGKYIEGTLQKTVKLEFRTISLAKDVANLCESHGWGVCEANDSRHPDKAVVKLERERYISSCRLNLQYLACCLRLGDILDFDRTRTPLTVYDEIDFTEDASIEEWNKHLSIQGWRVDEHRVKFSATCTHPAYYVAVHDFLNWVDDELREWRYLLDETPAADVDKYALDLMPLVDRRQVRMDNPKFVAGGFRFRLEYDEIMRLLMDKSLYPDSSLFLRELLQNALDACRYQHALAKEANMDDKYEPRILVWDHSEDEENPRIVFMDNGVGMSQRTVENFFLRVGKSFYRSPEFKAERQRLEDQEIYLDACSQFGIGFLSCFLGGDRIEVVTYSHGSAPLKITITGRSKYFLIEQLETPTNTIHFNSPRDPLDDGPPNQPGTRVTVFLKDGWQASKEEPRNGIVNQTLDQFAVNQEYDIRIFRPGRKQTFEIKRCRWNDAQPLAMRTHDDPEEVHALLAASSFRLEDYCRDLWGVGAIWMLNDGKDGPCPARGDLQASPGHVSIGSQDLRWSIHINEVTWSMEESELDKLATALESTLNDESPDLERLMEVIESTVPAGWEDLKELWSSRDWSGVLRDFVHLSRDERISGLDAWRGIQYRPSVGGWGYWYDHTRVWKALVDGDRRALYRATVSEHLLAFDEDILTLPSDYVLSLFGINAPGGIASWDPSRVQAERADFLPSGVTVRIDARARLAVQPSASRLFVPDDNAESLKLAVGGAFLDHAWELLQDHKGDPAWETWFGDFLDTCDGIGSAVGKRREQLSDYIRVECRMNGDNQKLSLPETIKQYGPLAPIGSRYKKDGILIDDYGNPLLRAMGFKRIKKGNSELLDLSSIGSP